MKKNFTTFVVMTASLLFLNLNAQTPLPYFTGFDNLQGQTGWTTYKKISTTSSSWNYVSAPPNYSAYSTPSCAIHFYPVGDLTLDWLVSPPFNFSAGGNIDSVRYAFAGFSPTPLVADTVAIFLLRGSPDPDLATSKVQLIDFRNTNYINDGVWRISTNIPIPAGPGQSFIAFKYKASSSWLDVRFDNLALKANGAAPTASFSVSSSAICKGQSIVFSDLSVNTPTAWSWQFQGGTPATSSVKNPTVSFSNTGVFTASLVSSNSFGASTVYTKTISVSACTGLSHEDAGDITVAVYPNPANGKFTLETNTEAGYIIYNVLGKEICQGRLQANGKNEINIESQPEGVYFIRLDDKSTHRAIKIIKD